MIIWTRHVFENSCNMIFSVKREKEKLFKSGWTRMREIKRLCATPVCTVRAHCLKRLKGKCFRTYVFVLLKTFKAVDTAIV